MAPLLAVPRGPTPNHTRIPLGSRTLVECYTRHSRARSRLRDGCRGVVRGRVKANRDFGGFRREPRKPENYRKICSRACTLRPLHGDAPHPLLSAGTLQHSDVRSGIPTRCTARPYVHAAPIGTPPSSRRPENIRKIITNHRKSFQKHQNTPKYPQKTVFPPLRSAHAAVPKTIYH